MWINNLNPTLLDLGPVEIRWYGLVYLLGFALSIWWLKRAQKQGMIHLSTDDLWDLALYLLIGVLVGSRVFELFWEPQYYLSNPLNILKIWQGGMSFHGGFVGIIAACWWYCKKKKVQFGIIADVLSAPLMFALALGRLANFVNGELVGRVWNGSWCVVFPQYGEECRHPNMIYSFFQRMAAFGWLYWLSVQQKFKPGFVFWNFVFWEGVGRFVMDFYREDILYAGLSLGQWFSIPMIVAGLYMFNKFYKEDWRHVFSKHS